MLSFTGVKHGEFALEATQTRGVEGTTVSIFFLTGGSSSWDTSASIRPVETIKVPAFFNSLTTGSFSAPFEVWRSCEDCTAAGNSGLRYVSWWWRMSYLVWLSGIRRHFLWFLRSKHKVIKGIFAHLFGSKDMTEYWDDMCPKTGWVLLLEVLSLAGLLDAAIVALFIGIQWASFRCLKGCERHRYQVVLSIIFLQIFFSLFLDIEEIVYM